jgi:hypothetical protein
MRGPGIDQESQAICSSGGQANMPCEVSKGMEQGNGGGFRMAVGRPPCRNNWARNRVRIPQEMVFDKVITFHRRAQFVPCSSAARLNGVQHLTMEEGSRGHPGHLPTRKK